MLRWGLELKLFLFGNKYSKYSIVLHNFGELQQAIKTMLCMHVRERNSFTINLPVTAYETNNTNRFPSILLFSQ
jgi:hypothetical protein